MGEGSLANKIVMVTGAGSGIGRAAARLIAQAGASVVAIDRNGSSASEIAAEIRDSGGKALEIAADVSNDADVASAVEQTLATFGRLDGAFNNAGVEQHHLPLHELALEQWERVMSVDLTGVFLCIRHQVRPMMEQGRGSIVNTASGLGQVAIANAAEYCAAKAGVVGLTRAAAVEYGPQNIRVNAILPGLIETDIFKRTIQDARFAAKMEQFRNRHAMKRFGQPDEVGRAAEWLLSDSSSFVTGASLAVDGGFLAG